MNKYIKIEKRECEFLNVARSVKASWKKPYLSCTFYVNHLNMDNLCINITA